jgi:hypothetical protein
MRILISIVLIVGLCFVILGALVSVLRELLIRITIHSPSQYDGPGVGSEREASVMVSEQVR